MKTLFDSDLTLKEAEELIRNGANVNEINKNGETPLFYLENVSIAKLFIAHGADVDAKNQYGCTPLFYADEEEMIQLLIAHGADVNMLNNDLDSPLLHYVASIEAIKLFFENGANLNIIDKDGFTPLDLMDTELSTYLISIGGIAGKIETYKRHHDSFSEEQQKAFDMFLTLTTSDTDFFHMCLAYQEGVKNNVKIEIKDMDLLC